MKFKVGDKVLYNPPARNKGLVGDSIGIILHLRPKLSYPVYVKWDTDTCIVCGINTCSRKITARWYRLSAIKHAVKKNQQLLFSFMR